MIIEVPIVNAFVDEPGGGNPAGVVLKADQYTTRQKQLIAAAVGMSETAFVSPSTIADFKVEFFTPTRQIAHCGHATIATFSYMRQIGMLPNDHTSKETIDGSREILLEEEYAFMEQSAPQYTVLNREHLQFVLESIGIGQADLLDGSKPCIINTGNSFLVVALRSSDIVKSVKPALEKIAAISEQHDLIGYYLFSRQTSKKGRDASARMFAPRYGIDEEAATGMAAGPLACYLYDKLGMTKISFAIEQGYLMAQPSPSVILVRLNVNEGVLCGLMAGGKATISEIRKIDLQQALTT